jgi:hypothetical protein
VAGQEVGLGLAAGREVEAGEAAVEDPARVLHLPVSDQVDDGLGHALILAGLGNGGSDGSSGAGRR